jgi:hypothetical protein
MTPLVELGLGFWPDSRIEFEYTIKKLSVWGDVVSPFFSVAAFPELCTNRQHTFTLDTR